MELDGPISPLNMDDEEDARILAIMENDFDSIAWAVPNTNVPLPPVPAFEPRTLAYPKPSSTLREPVYDSRPPPKKSGKRVRFMESTTTTTEDDDEEEDNGQSLRQNWVYTEADDVPNSADLDFIVPDDSPPLETMTDRVAPLSDVYREMLRTTEEPHEVQKMSDNGFFDFIDALCAIRAGQSMDEQVFFRRHVFNILNASNAYIHTDPDFLEQIRIEPMSLSDPAYGAVALCANCKQPKQCTYYSYAPDMPPARMGSKCASICSARSLVRETLRRLQPLLIPDDSNSNSLSTFEPSLSTLICAHRNIIVAAGMLQSAICE